MAAKQAVLLVGIAIVFLLGLSAVDAGAINAGENHTVTNESWTSDPGTWVALENSNIDGAAYHDDEVVRDENDTVMTEGSDYAWNQSTGEVKALSGGDLDPSQSANITYNYTTYSGEQQGFIALFAGIADPATALLIVLAVVVIVAGLRFLTGDV